MATLAATTILYLLAGVMYLNVLLVDNLLAEKRNLVKPLGRALIYALLIILIWPVFVVSDLYNYFRN